MDILSRKQVEVTYVVYKVCNRCKTQINLNKDDHVEVTKLWGYFSDKDGEYHKFDLCEKCYDELVKDFVIDDVRVVTT